MYTHIESSQTICNVNQYTGFYMSLTFAWYGLNQCIFTNFTEKKIPENLTFHCAILGYFLVQIPILAQYVISIPPENIRKLKVFWNFYGL